MTGQPGEDLSPEPLTGYDLDSSILLRIGMGFIAESDSLRAMVPESEPCQITPAELFGPMGDTLEHGIEVQGGIDISRQRGHNPGFTSLPLGLCKESGILQR